MEREVIVVGAGPAGATTAMSLARKGHDVLLLDRLHNGCRVTGYEPLECKIGYCTADGV